MLQVTMSVAVPMSKIRVVKLCVAVSDRVVL